MRRSITLLRGSKGYSWYGNYKIDGNDAAFLKYIPPTPFAWPKLETGPRPRAYFDIKIGIYKRILVIYKFINFIFYI